MFSFDYEEVTVEDPPSQPTLDQTTILSSLLLSMLENERLHLKLSQTQEVSFSVSPPFSRDHEHHLEIQLKQVKIDNLTAMLTETQALRASLERQLQEALHRCAVLEANTKQELSEMRTQMHFYKNKYEQESVNAKRACKIEADLKTVRTQLQIKSKELVNKTAELQGQLSKGQKNLELLTIEQERRNREMRSQIDALRSELTNKEQECFSLRAALNDSPKLQELNRWIAKVKECEERQVQACARMSQLSQELCLSRQKCRRLQNQQRDLIKLKTELQNALTENKGNEDSMVIYFDRLETYERVIKELEDEIKRIQGERKNDQKTHQAKLEAVQKDKQAVVEQWRAITDEMSKQKNILASLQKQVQKYQKFIAEQNERQIELARNEQISQLRAEEERKRIQFYQPYSFINNSNCTQRSNRSFSLQSKRTQKVQGQVDPNSSNIMQSHLICQQPSRQIRSNSSIGRAVSEQRIVYHSDSNSRLNTQSSNVSARELGCGDCMNRPYDYSTRSQQRQEELRTDITQINDEKKLLMEKLNILRPQDPNASLRADRNVSNLYTKSYRPSSNNFKLTAQGAKQAGNQASGQRLQLGRGREQKQNLNDMIVKRYTNLMQRS